MLALAAVAGCSGDADRPTPGDTAAVVPDWRRVATSNDRERLRGWRTAWTTALTQARAGGGVDTLRREGALLQPDAAMENPAPPPGAYRCRVLKLGNRLNETPGVRAYPSFACRIDGEGAVDGFYKVGGSQRPQGLLFPDGPRRHVFLGTLLLGDETRAVAYGADPDRDMAGVLERIGPRRWRLVLPYPRFESTLDVIELVPAD